MQDGQIKYAYLRHLSTGHGYAQFGGATLAYTLDDATQNLYIAMAICHRKDRFCRKTGRELAHARLLAHREQSINGGGVAPNSNEFTRTFSYQHVVEHILKQHDWIFGSILNPALQDHFTPHDLSDRTLEHFVRSIVDMGE